MEMREKGYRPKNGVGQEINPWRALPREKAKEFLKSYLDYKIDNLSVSDLITSNDLLDEIGIYPN